MTNHPPSVQRIHDHKRGQPVCCPEAEHTGRRGWSKAPQLAEVAVAYLDTEDNGGCREEGKEEEAGICITGYVDGLWERE